MKKILSLFLVAIATVTHAAQWPAGYGTLTEVLDADPVMVARSGVMKQVPASLLRQIQASQITDATALGRNFIKLTSATAIRYARINADDSITLLDAAGFLAAIGGQGSAVSLSAIASLTPAANKGIYYTGASTAALFDLSTFARTFLDDADAAAVRATLGLVIGTDVQAFNSKLAAMAGATQAADTLFYYTGASAGASTPLTTFGRSLIDDIDAATARATLGFTTWPGSTSIVTLGTITTGTWQGTVVSGTYLPTASTSTKGAVTLSNDTAVIAGTDTANPFPPSSLAAWWTKKLTMATVFGDSVGVFNETKTYAAMTGNTWYRIASGGVQLGAGTLVIFDEASGSRTAYVIDYTMLDFSTASINVRSASGFGFLSDIRISKDSPGNGYIDVKTVAGHTPALSVSHSCVGGLRLLTTAVSGATATSPDTHVVSTGVQTLRALAVDGDSTFTGNFVGNGTHYVLPNQTAPDGPSVMTRDLSDSRYQRWSGVPASSSAAGVAGQIAYDSTYIYICTATNTWKRLTLSTF